MPDLSGLGPIIAVGIITVVVAVPLAIWKLIDGVIWLVQHVSIS